ncbi:MAG: CRISPR-associated protein [Paludibacteraceae bacterium]|nr:CRISPR-associated protein [Paludibacteraceae bacterium]
MLINLSNHPTAMWLPKQIEAAHRTYGEVFDLPFPTVPADADEADIQTIAQEYLKKVQTIAQEYLNKVQTFSPSAEAVVHIMGEMTLTYALVCLLKQAGYTCVASTSVREVYEEEPGKKTAAFRFVRFRKY